MRARLTTWLVLLFASVAVAIGVAQDVPQDTTASIWSEMGASSARNGGISQSGGRGVAGGPAFAINPTSGDFFVAWPEEIDDTNIEIYVKRWDGTTWAEAGAGSATGGGISNSPAFFSEDPRLTVRPADGHVFLVWREWAVGGGGDIFAAEFDGISWQRLGPNNGQVSDVSLGTDNNALSAADPQIVLSSVFSTSHMPIVAWRHLVRIGQGNAIYVKRWTGVAWVEMGTGSASRYDLPHSNTLVNGQWVLGDFSPARGINADDDTFVQLQPQPPVAGPNTVAVPGNFHRRSASPRLVLNNFGRPAVVFLNGSSRSNLEQYPYGVHVRSFIGDNSLPAYLAWEEVGRIQSGQSGGGYSVLEGEIDATWAENGTNGLYVAAMLYPSAAPFTRPRLLRVLQNVGTSWATVGPDVASGAAIGYQASLAKDSTGRVIVSWAAGDGADIYVVASGLNAVGAPVWAPVGAGSASGLGISDDATESLAPDVVVDSRNGTDAYIVGWQDFGTTPQAFVRSTHPQGGGGLLPPGAPSGLTATAADSPPGERETVAPAVATVSLTWNAPTTGGAPTTYIVEAGSAPGLTDLASVTTGNIATQFVAPGVADGTYYLRVRAANASGTSGPSNEVALVVGAQQPTIPGPPVGLTAAVAAATVTLSWAAPTTGGVPTTYIIEAGTASGLVNLANFPTGNTTTAYAATSVPNGTYVIRVRAGNAAGTSGPSNEVTAVVGQASPGIPLPPSGLTASWVASTVTLAWNAPAADGPPTSYIVEAGSAPGLADLAVISTGSTATTMTARDVGNGTYYVRVRAANALGTSAPSNEVTVVIGADACSGDLTVRLTWDTGSTSGTPTWVDLDLHVTEPDGTHVYYFNQTGGRSVRMFGDNTTGFGPEVICTPGAALNGVYAIDVAAFSGNQWPTTATVTITARSAAATYTRVFAAPDNNILRRVATVAFPALTITPASGFVRAEGLAAKPQE